MACVPRRCVFESKSAWLEVLHDLGSMYQKKRNFMKARKVLRRYMEEAPRGSVAKETLSMVGLAATAMGDISEGLRHYRAAIALDADFKEAWLNLFQGLKECGRVRCCCECGCAGRSSAAVPAEREEPWLPRCGVERRHQGSAGVRARRA